MKEKLKLLVVGGGGREHTILWKLAQSPRVEKLYCAPGNGGIAQLAQCVNLKATDIEGVVEFAKREGIDLVFVAPDDPLVLGMVDALEAAGIRAFGPSKAAAIIEGSKAFSKGLMKKYQIPTADYEIFEKAEDAAAYIREKNQFPAVIKADGLALGKGVVIAQNMEEAEQALHSIMEDKIFGASGNRVVIEEFLTGQEVSVLCFTDGKTMKPMVSAQDHKRAFDHDQGPNTGGMGTFSPSRVYTDELAEQCMETIFLPTMRAMNQEGRTFRGVLYFGLILTSDGPKVIEYNCRFGDPETQVVLPRLKTDLLEILEAILDGRLEEMEIEWDQGAAVCVVLASGGYPASYETGKPIRGLEKFQDREDLIVFHAGTKQTAEGLVTSGGRVLGVTALADDLEQAIRKAYDAVPWITFENLHYRRDIGVK